MIDFGSQVLLSALDLEAGKTLLDVGCGYGPLGISLAKVQGVKVTMIDINSRAIDLARQNAQRNKVEATIFQSNIYENVTGSFDYIISNPPIRAGKKVVHQVIEEAYDYLNQGGNLTIVIQKNKVLRQLRLRWRMCLVMLKSLKRLKDIISLEVRNYENS